MSAPAKTRLPAAARRASIVDAAIDLFSKHGFRGATTRELAAACNISEPILYQHFETKRALYDAILEAKQRELRPGTEEALREADAAGDSPRFFRLLAEALLDWYVQDPRYVRLLMFAALEGHEISDLFFQRCVAGFYDLVTGHLQRQIEAGRFRPMEPLLAARTFAGMLAHHGTIYSIYCPGHLCAAKEDIVNAAADIFLKGIASNE